MFGASRKPYTAITVQIERLTGEQYEEHDFSGIVDLIEVVRLQDSGPAEAARAIRKKLKYGDVHRQLRALTILDGLIQNAGPRFQRAFADEPLLERLRVVATDPVSDPQVKAKCKGLFEQWAVTYKGTPGLERIAALYKQLPQRKKPQLQQQSKVLKETEAEAEAETAGETRRTSITTGTAPTASSSSISYSHSSSAVEFLKSSKSSTSKSKKDKSFGRSFNLEKEKPQLLQTLASSSVASTNLMNALKLVNRERKRVSEDPEVLKQFDTCKSLRRQILRYIQFVESEQWLGGLIHANEELVNALMAFEVLDKSLEDDSDSEENEWDDDNSKERGKKQHPNENVGRSFAGLTLGHDIPDKRLAAQGKGVRYDKGKGRVEDIEEQEADEEEDDADDPFADRNAISTPQNEQSNW